jgi:hypothetical protein
MEGVALTFGVVSLSLQLIEISVKVRQVLNSYRSASKDVSSLVDKLCTVENSCHTISQAFQTANKNQPRSNMLQLGGTLETCLARVSELDQVLK